MGAMETLGKRWLEGAVFIGFTGTPFLAAVQGELDRVMAQRVPPELKGIETWAKRLRRGEPSRLDLKLMRSAVGQQSLDRVEAGFRIAIKRFGNGVVRRQALVAKSVVVARDGLDRQTCVFQQGRATGAFGPI